MADARLSELGFYVLPGHTDTPADAISEARAGEALGLGAAFISERFNVKDAGVLSGAVGAVTTELGIATAATNHNTRHLLATATMATTMHRLTHGRFCLGLGRGFDFLFDVISLPRITNVQIEDAVAIYRRLWHGEVVMGHDGPAGAYPVLHQDARFSEDIPVLLCALAEQTLERAGAYVDAVVLHTYFTDETLARSVAAVRRGAERAGRDPASVRVWSVLGTVGHHLSHEAQLRKTVGRISTYLQAYGDLLVRVNHWDPDVLARFRADDVVASIPGAIDAIGTVEQWEHIAGLLPDEWMAAAAVGTPTACAQRVVDQFAAGADSVILHGATPDELAPVVDAYRSMRPLTMPDLPTNPGWMAPPPPTGRLSL
ncbi:MAG: TIGR03857 family LLM class F420-dependent oxidoreductase [Acidimicrobiia bacterium]